MGIPTEAAPRPLMDQYEIRWADMPPPVGRRPVLLLSRTASYEYLNKVIVVEITTTVRGIPQEVFLGTREGLRRRCVANLDNIHVLPKDLLGTRLGALDPSRENELKRALGYALGWAELKSIEQADGRPPSTRTRH
jgi:mRNA interferase MazF